ncbi:hypothetical protein ACNKHT_19410 [Shigella flexneri]
MPMEAGAIRSGRPDPDNELYVALAVLPERTCPWSNNPYVLYPDCDIHLKCRLIWHLLLQAMALFMDYGGAAGLLSRRCSSIN